MTDLPDLALDTAPGAARGRLVLAFWGAVAVSLAAAVLPYGAYVLYPFTILGTWAHEMGHGLMAVVLGGTFNKLVLLSGGGGYALVGTSGRVSSALVSAAGLLGPAIFGAAVIIGGARKRTAKWVLAVIAVLVAVSIVAVVRSVFGVVSLGLISAVLIPVAFKAPEVFRLVVTQLVGIQFCLKSWASVDYMFTKEFTRGGETLTSDSGAIAEALFLPYWFWGALIAVLSAAILAWAFYVAWVRPLRR